ncbi:MAG: cytochrome c3 family protein [Actinobacteria bacterium]|nr:cytochrome c3 family protein [Actinomycetota bacterium]
MNVESTGTARGRHLAALLGLAGAVVAVLALTAGTAAAQDDEAEPADQATGNEACLSCHGNPGFQTTLPSGEVLPLTFDVEAHEASVHGPVDIPCVLCHTDISGFPHDPFPAPDVRTWVVDLNQACAGCHTSEATATMDNVHSAALAGGNLDAAVCTDCHGSHEVSKPVAHTPEVAETCRNCHYEIYEVYEDSVHGAALLSGVRDVPTCTDCHGVHDVEGPSLPEFHLFSPQLCANCHSDPDLMSKYGIRADTFDTYISDFHGTTVVLYEALAPGQETNKPVCIDCHGVHSIQSADNPNSQTFKDNILRTCQRCHPDATDNFPASWLGHYTPAPGQATLVWLAQWFYRLIIPITIGAMGVYVVLLTFRDRRTRKGAANG